MKRLINRYILREITLPFIMILFVLTFVLLMGKILQLMDLMINKGVGFGDIARLMLFLMPSFLMFTIPISFLIAILIGIGRLSGDNEITILKMSGVSLYQLSVPIAFASLATFLLTAATSLFLVPYGNVATKNLLFDLAKQKASIGIKEKVFIDDFQGILLYAGKIPIHGDFLEGVLISDSRIIREPSTIIAKKAYLISDPNTMVITLRLEDGSTHTVDAGLKNYRKMDFRFYDVRLDLASSLSEGKKAIDKASTEMTAAELIKNMNARAIKDVVFREMAIELNKKLTVPLSCLVFGLLGLPLGIRAHRSVRSRGFTVGLAVVVAYYLLRLGGEAMVETGRLSPFIGTWAPNGIFAVVGVILFFFAASETSPASFFRRRPCSEDTPTPPSFVTPLEKKENIVIQSEKTTPFPPSKVALGEGKVSTAPEPHKPEPLRRAESGTFFMKIVDRYLTREFTRNLLLITVSFISLFLIIEFFERIRMFLSNQATFTQMVSFFLFRIPMVLSQTLPATLLLASLMTCGLLSRHSEIVAMKANGISMYRIALPMLVVAVLVSMLTFMLSEWITPYTNERAEHIRVVEVQKQSSPGTFKRDQIWYRGQKGIYNFQFFDAQSNTLRGITIHYLDRNMNLTMRLDAEKGEWRDGRWYFFNVLTTRYDEGEFPALERSAMQIADLPEKPSDFKVVQKDVETMGYFELKRYIRKLQSEGYDVTRYVVDLHGKIAFSLVGIILTVIGIAFSLRSERSGGIAQGIGVGLILGFSYWLVYALGMSLGRSGTLPPLIAAWFANILFSAGSFWLIWRIKT